MCDSEVEMAEIESLGAEYELQDWQGQWQFTEILKKRVVCSIDCFLTS